METPDATTTAGSGRTTDQAEFEAGAELKRQGKQLPDDASEAAKRGYDSTESAVTDTTAAQPGTAREAEDKHLISHRVAPQAQTDRPEPTTIPEDAKPVNPNNDVTITKDVPGERYLIEGKGASVSLDFENDLTEEAVIAVVIDRLEGGRGETGPADNYSRNAVKDLKRGLDWLHQGTRERLKRLGVTSQTSPLAGGVSDRVQRG